MSLSLYPHLFQNTQSPTRPQRPRSPPLPDVIKNAPSRPPSSPLAKSTMQLKKSSSAWPNINPPKLASMLSREEASTSRTHQHTLTAGKSNSNLKTHAKPGTTTKPPPAALQNPKSSRETLSPKAAKVPAVKKSATVKCPQVRLNRIKLSGPYLLFCIACLAVSHGICTVVPVQGNVYFTLGLGCHSVPLMKTRFIYFLLDQTVSPEMKEC